MRVLTAEQMQKVDAETIDRVMPGIELMERAGRAIAERVHFRFGRSNRRAAIFVGPGNNGGDGLVVARLLIDAGWSCSIHLLKPGAECSPDTATNYQRLKGLPNLSELNALTLKWPDKALDDLRDATVLIDSIFGTGFTGAPRDDAARVIAFINKMSRAAKIPVISIDIPSGVNSTTGAVEGEAVNADLTLTLGAAKTGLLFHPGRWRAGELEVLDIGFPEDIITKHSDRVFYLGREVAASKLPPRAPDIHKYEAGTALVIAGSYKYLGAPMLAAKAALRSGCGMLFLAVPESIRELLSDDRYEVIFHDVPETKDRTISSGAREGLVNFVDKANALAIGPGMGRNDETDQFVRDFVVNCPKPIVVDADALTAFAGHATEFKNAKAPVMITPHDGELARLTGEKIPTEPFERIEYSRMAAGRLGVALVLKGAPTLIASPDGGVWINGSGSSALAKAGTGDVLTGFIVSFLAQALAGGRPAQEAVLGAALVGCYLHGRLGEIEASRRGERGVIASDLFATVGLAMVELEDAAR